MVNELDRYDASCIAILQEMVNSNELKVLKTDLVYIHAIIRHPITKLENDHKSVVRKKNGIQDIVNKINGLEADIVKQNFNSCFSINEEFTVT
jgi:hypothetical protein